MQVRMYIVCTNVSNSAYFILKKETPIDLCFLWTVTPEIRSTRATACADYKPRNPIFTTRENLDWTDKLIDQTKSDEEH